MKWYKCNSCGHTIDEERIAESIKETLSTNSPNALIGGTFTYETCIKCGQKDIETEESLGSMGNPFIEGGMRLIEAAEAGDLEQVKSL